MSRTLETHPPLFAHAHPETPLAFTREGPVTALRYLADVRAFAQRLPDAPDVLNVCGNRYAFAVGLGAALVKEKGHAIAILRTMGASRGAIMRIFFIIGASIGTIGTAAGFLLGVVISLNIETIREWIASLTTTDVFSPELYFLSQLPADMDATETITVLLMALALSFLATIYPAWRAARLDPVDALRYE